MFGWLLYGLSWGILALSRPTLLPSMSVVSACIGFALCWRGMDFLPRRALFKRAFLWFFFIQLVHLSWMGSIEYQGKYFLLLYVGVCGALGLQFAWMSRWIYGQAELKIRNVLAIASVWTLLEWGRFYVLCGFGFQFTGVLLSYCDLSLQLASISGVLGMSFFVMVTNLIALRWLRSYKVSSCIKWLSLALFPYLFGAGVFFVHGLYSKGAGVYHLLVVRTDLAPCEKYPLFRREQEFIHPLEQWRQVLEKLAVYKEKKIDLIVFPETAFTFGLQRPLYKKADVQKLLGSDVSLDMLSNGDVLSVLSQVYQAEILVGLDCSQDRKYYNSACLFSPGASMERYDKRVLLPIAEYAPFDFCKKFSHIYGIEDFFTPGKKASVLGACRVAPSICYDECFPLLARESKAKGARLLANLGNDAWYPASSLPLDRFFHGRIRAVEEGIPLVRSANGGVTAVVDCLGRVVGKEDRKGACQVLYAAVSRYGYKTFFSYFGHWPLLILCVLSVFLRKNCTDIGLDEK